jgi:hypothetical protein
MALEDIVEAGVKVPIAVVATVLKIPFWLAKGLLGK